MKASRDLIVENCRPQQHLQHLQHLPPQTTYQPDTVAEGGVRMPWSRAEACVVTVPRLSALLDGPMAAPVLDHEAVGQKVGVERQVEVVFLSVGTEFVEHTVPAQLVGAIQVHVRVVCRPLLTTAATVARHVT